MTDDLLQTMLNEAMRNSLIQAPIHHVSCPDFPVIQYADDTILVLLVVPSQLLHIKNLLLHFVAYTGLRTTTPNPLWYPLIPPASYAQSFLNHGLPDWSIATILFWSPIEPFKAKD